MIGRNSREDLDAYGIWPWLAGVLLGAGLIYLMHHFATPISGG